jgi:hypothetical protein
LGRTPEEVQSSLAQVCETLPPHLVVEVLTADHAPMAGWIEAPVVSIVASLPAGDSSGLRGCEHLATLEERTAARLNAAGVTCRSIPADGLIAHLVTAGEAYTAGKLLREGAQLFGSGDIPGAVTVFEEAMAFRPDDARTLNALGVARFATGDLGEAERLVSAARALDPGYQAAADNLAAIHQALR